ncbi:hypothetical protein CCACVL1_03060, partial [Corchorus capsularis]
MSLLSFYAVYRVNCIRKITSLRCLTNYSSSLRDHACKTFPFRKRLSPNRASRCRSPLGYRGMGRKRRD